MLVWIVCAEMSASQTTESNVPHLVPPKTAYFICSPAHTHCHVSKGQLGVQQAGWGVSEGWSEVMLHFLEKLKFCLVDKKKRILAPSVISVTLIRGTATTEHFLKGQRSQKIEIMIKKKKKNVALEMKTCVWSSMSNDYNVQLYQFVVLTSGLRCPPRASYGECHVQGEQSSSQQFLNVHNSFWGTARLMPLYSLTVFVWVPSVSMLLCMHFTKCLRLTYGSNSSQWCGKLCTDRCFSLSLFTWYMGSKRPLAPNQYKCPFPWLTFNQLYHQILSSALLLVFHSTQLGVVAFGLNPVFSGYLF